MTDHHDFVTLGVALDNARHKFAADPENLDAKAWLEVLERVEREKSILLQPK